MFHRLKAVVFVVAGVFVMGVAFSYLDRFDRWLGCNPERAETCIAKLIDWIFNGQHTEAERTATIRDDPRVGKAKLACMKLQQRYRIERLTPVTDVQISIFCDCLASALPALLTAQDRQNLASDDPVSSDLQKRFTEAEHKCERQLSQ